MDSAEVKLQSAIVKQFESAESYPHPVTNLRHVQTHISHLFLTGEYAYKIKKAVKFEFLDFTTLDKRKFFCDEELRLNSRYAPELYLEVVPIRRGNSNNEFSLDGTGEVVEYAVKMRQFDATFDQLAAENRLGQGLLLDITDAISSFHSQASPAFGYWEADEVRDTIRNNLRECADISPSVLDQKSLALLTRLTEGELDRRYDLIRKRQSTHIRQLHGDMHLRNMCVYRDEAHLFDGIEFNPHLSNCDVWADLSFFVMDLFHRGNGGGGALVWNRYLQNTDDFEGLQLLDLYSSYHATVRAKIACLESASADSINSGTTESEAGQYISLALDFLKQRAPLVIAVGGLAGSGKTTLSSILAQHFQAVHIRSDAVRKHIYGVPLSMQAPQQAYSDSMNRVTFDGMLERAAVAVDAGRPIIFDTVFNSPTFRNAAENFAKKHSLKFAGIWCEVPQSVARERARLRSGDVSDADQSIVDLQHSYYKGNIDWLRLDTSGERHETAARVIEQLYSRLAEAVPNTEKTEPAQAV